MNSISLWLHCFENNILLQGFYNIIWPYYSKGDYSHPIDTLIAVLTCAISYQINIIFVDSYYRVLHRIDRLIGNLQKIMDFLQAPYNFYIDLYNRNLQESNRFCS